MACVVSVKKTSIENGRLKTSDISNIWTNYEKILHEWMLKLTETFDLTYTVDNRKMIIVPCLLPDKEPEIEWPDIVKTEQINSELLIFNFNLISLEHLFFNKIFQRFKNKRISSCVSFCVYTGWII